MNHINFAIRTVSLLIILVALGQYQNIALARAAEAEARELQIEEVEAYNASVLAQMSAESEAAEDNAFTWTEPTKAAEQVSAERSMYPLRSQRESLQQIDV